MSLPETYRAFRRTTGELPRTIELSTEEVLRELGPNEVLIKIHAVSLNFRDVAMLNGRYPVEARSALLQGTGGVSMFALLICVAAGIQPIITSSSDEKLAAIKKLGSQVRGINYKVTLDQESEVKRLTDGLGVDFVVNNTGPASIPQDISFLRQRGGTVSLVGFLDGTGGDWQPAAIMALMGKSAQIKGIATGSKEDYLSLNKFLQENKVSLDPLVDRVFSFEDSPAAFDYLYSGKHVGKVIIKI
ncbi:alcohol dehydrogenase [Fusarium mexicanum]|uniref:Alcohol dehydrogenase n=1 Tax=Fusarium mexicanum TaxID=751941 RepID=A0A8H5I9A5_9HYPO|nr:alcohol dehydrogenase [Fusarium mexicanum]